MNLYNLSVTIPTDELFKGSDHITSALAMKAANFHTAQQFADVFT